MTEIGVVTKLDGQFATVEIGRHSACEQCGKCGMTAKQKKVQFFTQNTCNAVVGDKVALELPDINTLGLAVVAYLIPLAFLMLFVLGAWLLGWADWAMLVSAIVGLVLAYVVVSIIDRRKKHRWVSSPTMVNIIKTEE